MMPKAAWDPEYHRVFVDLCVQEKVVGNKPGTQNILEPFQQRTGSRFKKNQLKNHWDTMIKQWKIWRRLVQSTSMKWDPVTNKFGASDQDWAEYLQLNPDAAPYRLEPPLFLKKLEFIFEGSNLDDEGASGSQRKLRIEYLEEENDTGDEDRQSASNNFLTAHTKGYWSPSTHELFVDLLVEETRKGNRPDTHYPKESWRIMLETINKNSGRTYTRAQLKNHWDCTRKGWKIWCQLIGAPIMKWDEKSRSFGATAEDWKVYLQENPRASQFRRKHVLHADKLATIFAGVIEPGKAYFRPYRKRAREQHHSESPQLHDPTPLSTLYTNEPFTGTEFDYDDDEEPTQQRRRFNGVGFAESRLQDVEIAIPACHQVNTERVNESPVSASVKQYEFTIGECIECLDSMEEVEQGSDLYMCALDLFLKKEYREVFLQLKNSSVRMSWLLRRRSA
ncbi:L10-interacting MYB domain-containing protein [Cardamine amara subsp. amara]|uniref:L10-interacting MYB domain-containing protein n=1 Tax=Cardamine amara subsp. amara TaxID=228776 RepID=A0ABD1BY86_CARAN